MKKQIALALSALVILSVAGCRHGGGASLTSDVAVVDGHPITAQDFYNYIIRKPTVEIRTRNGAVEAQVLQSLGLQALRDLVNRELILEMAQSINKLPDEAAIDAEIKFRTSLNPNYMNILRQQSISLDLIRRDIKLELARENVLTNGITVTPQEVDAFIKGNPASFTKPASALVKMIVVSTPEKENQVDSALKGGQDFTQVALRYSEDPNVRTTQAAFPVNVIDQMPPQLKDLVNAATEGTSTKWIPSDKKFYKFYVTKKTPAVPIPITDAIKEQVKRQIAMQKGSKAIDLKQRVEDSLKKANITVNLEGIQPQWDAAMKQLKAEPAGPAALPPVGSSGTSTAPATSGTSTSPSAAPSKH